MILMRSLHVGRDDKRGMVEMTKERNGRDDIKCGLKIKNNKNPSQI